MTAAWVRHPTTGQLRLRHDGSQRWQNRSLAWRKVEEAQLAATPYCERCGAPAVEAHNTSGAGICTVSPPHDTDAVESLCRACHDLTLCTAPPVMALDRLLLFE